MFTEPENNIKQFKLREGMVVADLGAGAGAHTLPAAREVGSSGYVYAIEVQKDLLGRLKSDAERAGLSNVEVIWGDVEKIGGTKIRNDTVDAVIVANVLFQLEDKNVFVDEVKRILKPEGRVLVIDWLDSSGGMGPDSSHIVPKDKARGLFEGKGFEFEEEINAGEQHYGMIFSKK